MSLRDIIQLRRQSQARKQDKRYRIRASITEVNGSIWASQGKLVVWFMPVGEIGTPGQAYCRSVFPYNGMPVEIEFVEGVPTGVVTGLDPYMVGIDHGGSPWLAKHHTDHEYGGRDAVWLYPEAVPDLALLPGAGLSVTILSGDYEYEGTRKTFAGKANYSISSQQPTSGNHRLVGFYLNSSNTLQIVAGSIVAVGTSAPEPSWQAGAYELGVVDLDGDQTTVAYADIDNRKLPWAAFGSGIPESLIDAKGDLIVGLADDTAGRLDPGGDRQVLTLDSAQTEGMKWRYLPFPKRAEIIVHDASSGQNVLLTSFFAINTLTGDGDTVLVGAKSWTDTITISNDIHLVGVSDRDVVVTGGLTVTNGAKIENIVRQTNSAGFNATTTDGAYFRRCTANITTGGPSRAGFSLNVDTTVELCNATVSGGATANYGVALNSSNTATIKGGVFSGTTADLYSSGGGATYKLEGPVLENNTMDLNGDTVTGYWYDGDGNMHVADGNDVYLPDETTIGLFSRVRTRTAGLPLITDFRNSTGISGASFAGSPFESSPTTVFWDDTIYLIQSSTTAGAFYQKSVAASPTGKHILARTGLQLASTYGGLRIDDGTDNNYVMWLLDSATTSSGAAVLRFVERVGAGTPTVTTFTVLPLPPFEFYPLLIRTIDLGSGSWRADPWVAGESPTGVGFNYGNGSTVTWTMSRAGLFVAKSAGTVRNGLFDRVTATLIT